MGEEVSGDVLMFICKDCGTMNVYTGGFTPMTVDGDDA